MKRLDEYCKTLQTLDDWDAYLLAESGLPGARANLELAQAVAAAGDRTLFERYLMFDAARAPANSPPEFLALCGVIGLGRLLSEGDTSVLAMLRTLAGDPRWRVREGVALALQKLGSVNMEHLLAIAHTWSQGNLLEKRAAVAAVCEPPLLREPAHIRRVLQILDAITTSIPSLDDRKSESFQALRKALGYCWSIAVAALPGEGKPAIEKWFAHGDHDIRWIMKENLKKQRLARMDADWIAHWQARI